MPGAASDERLIATLRAGDPYAFEAIDRRYRPQLVRFAQRVLGPAHAAVAEDVVQEALLRAYRALLRDDRAIDLRPWLYRLTRNCCLDEIGRVRTDTVDLTAAADVTPGPAHAEPAVAAERRARLREVLADLAVLPASQRHALLRREVDGVSHRQLAAELGMSEQATRSLVHRARAALADLADARSAACAGVREDLIRAHDLRRRAPARALRHLAGCGACRAFRTALRAERRALALLVPAGPLALVAGGLGGKLLLGGGSHGLASKAGAGAAATTLAVTGVAGVVAAPQVFRGGDAAPVALRSPALPPRGVARGQALPAGTAVVRRPVVVAGRAEVALACPDGLAVADLLPPQGARVDAGYGRGTVLGLSRIARIRVRAREPGTAKATVAVLCKRPDAGGSLRWSAQGP